MGATGSGGSTGSAGQKGEPGSGGSGGDKGQKGEVGATGSGGSAGQKGEQGSGGSSGSDGAAGDKGQKGEGGSTLYAVPQGGIIIWSGASNAIPSGWVLCNGSNGTPNLIDRFIIGATGAYNVGTTGGSANATLVSHSHTINNHTHSFSGSGSHSHSHSLTTGNDQDDNLPAFDDYINTSSYRSSANTNAATVTISISGNTGNPSNTGTNSQGSSATDKNLPPYYALCYIMKT